MTPSRLPGHVCNRCFFLALALACLLTLGLPFWLTSTPLYCRHSQVFWDPVDCYKYTLRDQTADIVFVGDSSLANGIRPRRIAAALGLSGINLGEPGGIIDYAPYRLLDHYLRDNRRPRLIVLYLNPWGHVGGTGDDERLWYDAARFELRHATAGELAGFFLDDPRRLIRYPAVTLAAGPGQVSASGAWWRAAVGEMDAEDGYIAPWRPERVGQPAPGLLADDCVLPRRPVDPSREPIRRFRERYQRDGTSVLVYVAPVPECDASREGIAAAWAGVADNHPASLPGHDFVADDWRAHVTLAGADAATDQMIAFLASPQAGPALSLRLTGAAALPAPAQQP